MTSPEGLIGRAGVQVKETLRVELPPRHLTATEAAGTCVPVHLKVDTVTAVVHAPAQGHEVSHPLATVTAVEQVTPVAVMLRAPGCPAATDPHEMEVVMAPAPTGSARARRRTDAATENDQTN
jgi:hypothetical protein